MKPSGSTFLALNWSEGGKPPPLMRRSIAKEDPDPEAISRYGLFLPEFEQTWLRFVEVRAVSGITTFWSSALVIAIEPGEVIVG